MSKLWLMIGAPGSGKSTYLKKHHIPRSMVVSRDEIRYSLVNEDEPYFSKEKEVYKIFIDKIAAALADEAIDVVFVDQTSLDRSARAKLLNALKDRRAHWDELNAIVIKRPLQETLEFNAKRSGRERVPDDVVTQMWKKLTIPTVEENFTNIYIYNGKE